MACAIENSLLFQEVDRLTLVLESIGDAVISLDSEGQIQFINRAAEETYGYCQEEVLGKPMSLFSPPSPESQDQCREFLAGVLDGGWRSEVRQVRKGGEEFQANLTGAPVRGRSGGGDRDHQRRPGYHRK